MIQKPHHIIATHKTRKLQSSANISGLLKKITLTTLYHSASFHHDHHATAQVRDATSASVKSYLSCASLNCGNSINVMNLCPPQVSPPL